MVKWLPCQLEKSEDKKPLSFLIIIIRERMESKSREKLVSFIDYCIKHPQERFWQALRNWSGYSFIFGWRPKKLLTMKDDGGHFVDTLSDVEKLGLEDTFYWE